MADWLRVDAGDRNEVAREWRSGKLTLLKSERTSDAGVETGQHIATDDGIQIGEHDDENTRYPVCRMPFRKQLLSQFTADELRHHVTREQYEAISALEMDTDNSYVQNLLLAAENCEEIKGYDTKDLWRYTDAIRKVFSQEKRHELALVLRFTKIWAETDYIDRGILAREWAAGNHISSVQRTDSGTNADGGYVTDRGEGAHHTMDTLDLEIACALLPMDFHHFEIPSSVLRRAKEIVAKREEPWKSWSAILRNQPGVLSVNRAAIFNVIRIAPENIHHTPVVHLEFVNKTMTAEFNSAVELLPLSEPVVEVEAQATQPKVENLGGGIFSIDALLGGTTDPVINTSSNEVQKTENAAETTSDVQMETTQPEKVENTDPVQPGEGADAADTQAVTVAPAEILAAAAPSLTNQEQAGVHQKTDSVSQEEPEPAQSEPKSAQNEPEVHQEEPAVEYPAYFEPGRYEGLPNEVYHAANGISSTQVKDARVSLMYFNARHVEKTIVKERSAVLDMGNLVHALALQPEQLDAEFSIEPVIPEGAFTTTATLRAFIDEYNNGLPVLLSADDTRNSPLWVSKPDQQIAYLGVKYWARLYCPHVILGVYTPDEIEQPTEREINPASAHKMSLADIKGENVVNTQDPQEPSVNIDTLAQDFRDRIEAAQDVDSAKAVRADIETAKATLGSALFTELKNKAVKRYYLVDARNKVEAAINSLPSPEEPDAAERFVEAERVLASSKRHLGDELHDQFSITLADMRPEYVD